MKRISINTVGLAVVAALGLAGTTWAVTETNPNGGQMGSQPPAQEPGSSSATQEQGSQMQPGNLTSGERNFLQSAAEINATEVQLGRIAEQKSDNPNIKRIGEDLVRSHTEANQQLQRLASSKGVSLTEQPTSAQQRMIDSLSQASGDRFNRQFLRQSRISQERALSLFEKASRRAQDSDIRSWAGKMVPSLQEHIAMIKGGRPQAVAEKTNRSEPQLQNQPSQNQKEMPQHQPSGGQQPQGGY